MKYCITRGFFNMMFLSIFEDLLKGIQQVGVQFFGYFISILKSLAP